MTEEQFEALIKLIKAIILDQSSDHISDAVFANNEIAIAKDVLVKEYPA